MQKSKSYLTKSTFLSALALTLAALGTPSPALADPKDYAKSACFTENQKQILCKYFFKNIGTATIELGDWLWHHLRGMSTPHECMIESFEKNPELYENLRMTEGRRYPTAENQVMIYNTPEGMRPVIEKTIGFCYGHATIRNYLSRLTYFDPKGKFEALPKFPEGSKEWVEFYRARMEKIIEGEPQVIPGFPNLRAFTAHPDLNNWFKREATLLWANRVAHVKNLVYRVDHRPMTQKFSYKLVDDIQERLDRGYNPIIMFDANKHKLVPDYADTIHVASVVGLFKMENDRTAIVILDDKKPFPYMYDVVILNHKGAKGKAHAYFDKWRWVNVSDHDEGAWDMGMGTVEQIRLVTEGDTQAMTMAMNTAAFCKKNPQICAELGDRTVHPMPSIHLPKAEKPFRPFKYLLDSEGKPIPYKPSKR